MKPGSRRRRQSFWPAVPKKWLNIKSQGNEFSADEQDTESDFEEDDSSITEEEQSNSHKKKSIFHCKTSGIPLNNFMRTLRRRKSETMQAQYIDTEEIKISVGTWNVAGRLPPDDLDVGEWLAIEEPADIYVIGFQEVVPLNAGNVLGAEDSSPISKWEALIRKTLNKAHQAKPIYKCYSAPPPENKASATSKSLADELLAAEADAVSDRDMNFLPERLVKQSSDAFFPLDSKCKLRRVHSVSGRMGLDWQDISFHSVTHDLSSNGKLKRGHSSLVWPCVPLQEQLMNSGTEDLSSGKLKKVYSVSGNVGLIWPELSLDIESLGLLPIISSLENAKKDLRQSLQAFAKSNLGMIPLARGVRTNYVRIASKQMIGLFVTVSVRRTLRKHIHNLKVSPVGVGLMGYMGNKGSISVSMSIYQTSLCLVCSHLTSGEKEGDELQRNSDVQEILHRTHFPSVAGAEFPETILEHDLVIWFGDLNYRLNMADDETRKLVAKEEWETLISRDQLRGEMHRGHAFDGWHEGCIDFGPTYKYDFNSDKYIGEVSKHGEKRRTPAWCDRILWFGKGTKQLSYNRIEIMLSDHRPVNSVFLAEVEIFSHRKLQKAFNYTDAELGAEELMP